MIDEYAQKLAEKTTLDLEHTLSLNAEKLKILYEVIFDTFMHGYRFNSDLE